jgi:quinol monooxygenase YgiN
MKLFIFARFHSRENQDETVASVLRRQIDCVRSEPGCITIGAYRSTRSPRLFFLHSIWIDEAAFEVHAALPNTVQFVERIESLVDHPLDVTRSRSIS